jgi:O-antigen/teichoic acid export membrane protein
LERAARVIDPGHGTAPLQPRRSFLSTMGWNVALVAFAWPLSVATSVVIGRWLGPERKGEYTLASLVGTLFLTALGLGIPASISYYLGGGKVPASSLVKTLVVLAMGLSAVALAITCLLDGTGWCLYVFGMRRLSPAVWLAVAGIPFALLGTFLQFVILAQGHSVWFAAVSALGQIAVSVLIGVLVLADRLTPFTAIAASLAAQAVSCLVLLAVEQRQVSWLHAPLLPRESWTGLIRFSGLNYIGGLFYFMIQRADVLMVSVLIGLRAVGIYSVAYGVAEVLLVIPQRLGVLYLPRVAAQQALSKEREVQVLTSTVFWGAALAAAALGVVASFAIPWLYGPAFRPSIAPFLLLLPGVCAMATLSVQGAYLCGVGLVRTTTVAAFVGMILNVVLNLVLIPRYGVSGAALASSITYGAQAAVLARAVAGVTHTRSFDMITSVSPRLLMAAARRALG